MKNKIKKIIKSPLLWVIACEVIVGIVLFLCGFRITYSPNLENSWDAVSAFAAWAGVIASTVAIFVAIQIPKKIAQRQDKIALFEKRIEFWETIKNCISVSHIMESEKKEKATVQKAFYTIFDSEASKPNVSDMPYKIKALLENATSCLKQGTFLFDFSQEQRTLVTTLGIFLAYLIYKDSTEQEFNATYSLYIEKSKEIEKNLIPIVEETLALYK